MTATEAWASGAGDTELTVRTHTRGLAARLAYDVSVVCREGSVALALALEAPASATGTAVFPTSAFDGLALHRTGSGEPAPLSEKDRALIRDKTRHHLHDALGDTLRVRLAEGRSTGVDRYAFIGTLEQNGLRLALEVSASLSETRLTLCGTSRVRLSTLGVGPVYGPLRAVVLADEVELEFKSVLVRR